MTLDIREVTADSDLQVLDDLITLLANHASGRIDERHVGEALVQALEEGTSARFFIGYRDDSTQQPRPAVAVACNLCASILTPGRHLVVNHVAVGQDTLDVRLCSQLLTYVIEWASANRCRYVSTLLDRADIVSQALFASSGFGLSQDIVHMDATIAVDHALEHRHAVAS